MEITFKGLDELQRNLQAVATGAVREAANALRAEAEVIMTEAKRRTPVLTGTLRASGNVTGPEQDGAEITVRLAFGGPAAEYAVYVHENMNAHHPVGQAKFLESAVLEAAPQLPAKVAERMKASLGT